MSIIAFLHSVKLCALAIRAFRSQRYKRFALLRGLNRRIATPVKHKTHLAVKQNPYIHMVDNTMDVSVLR